MAQRVRKRPKAREGPTGRKESRTGPSLDPASHDRETIVWGFAIADLEGPWGWRTEAAHDWWRAILPKLQRFESMTWAEIMQATGGRARGNNSHFVQVQNLTRQAKSRLAEIKCDDVDALFSLRLDGTTRVYGIRDGRALKLLWYDPYHGTNDRAVYPVRVRQHDRDRRRSA